MLLLFFLDLKSCQCARFPRAQKSRRLPLDFLFVINCTFFNIHCSCFSRFKQTHLFSCFSPHHLFHVVFAFSQVNNFSQLFYNALSLFANLKYKRDVSVIQYDWPKIKKVHVDITSNTFAQKPTCTERTLWSLCIRRLSGTVHS